MGNHGKPTVRVDGRAHGDSVSGGKGDDFSRSIVLDVWSVSASSQVRAASPERSMRAFWQGSAVCRFLPDRAAVYVTTWETGYFCLRERKLSAAKVASFHLAG